MSALKYFTCIFLLLQSISAQNFWQQTNGPYGIPTVYDFLQYNDSTIFLGTNEGIIRSQDNGESWNRILSVTKISSCLSKDSVGTLYCGAKDAANNYYLLRSTDEGNNWFAINNTFWADIRYIMITYKDTIMLGTWDKGVYRSFNYGTTWNRVNNGNIYNAIHEIIQLSDGSVLAGSAGGGVFKTTNWGDSWVPSNTGLPANSQGYRFAKSFCKTSPDCLLVGTQVAIYYSTNNGETWSFKSAGLTNKEINRIVKDETGILYAGTDMGNGVYYSSNAGDYWDYLGLGLTTYALGWDSESRLYAGGSNQGLYRFVSDDSTWIQVYNQGYTPVEVNHLWITDSGNLIAGTQWWGLYYTTNSGEIWKRIIAPAGFYAFETINDSIFVGGGSQHAYMSTDTGKTWQSTGDFYTKSMYYETISKLLYIGTNKGYPFVCGIYGSNDFGQSWELIHTFQSVTEGQWVNALLVTKTSHVILANVVYSGQYGGFYRFYKSTDNGQTWEIIFEHQSNGITKIIEDTSSNLFAIGNQKLYTSEDEGKTWITRNIPQSYVLAADNSGRIYRELAYSTDKGVTWIAMPITGLYNTGVSDLVINQNNRIYIGNSSGIFYGEADSLVVSVENIKPVKTFHLSHNYPNPFNPSTKIEFRIADFGLVTLKIYDVLGNEIATLVNEEKQPGTYEVEFNTNSHSGEGRNLTSGIYFYQLQVVGPETSSGQGTIETKKMVLIK